MGRKSTEANKRKHNSEAKASGVKIIGPGKHSSWRTYQFLGCGHKQEITLTNVRENRFRCKTCLQMRLDQEAKDKGLEIIGSGRNRHHRTYRFLDCGHEQEMQLSQVRMGVKCWICLKVKHKQEAKAAGLTLIGPSKDARYRTYRFIDCGHQQQFLIGAVRKKELRCDACLQERLHQEAKAAGLTLSGSGRSNAYRRYRFDVCGHEQEIQKSMVRNGEFRCDACFQDKLHQEAKAAGLTLIGPGRTASYRTYRCNDCGHEWEIYPRHVGINEFRCDACFQDKLHQEAEAAGLTLIGSGRTASYRTYRFNDCGHEQEIRTDAVRINIFICNTCEETSRDLPSKVYLIKIQFDSEIWLKLGYAKSIKARIKQYQLPKDSKIVRLKVINYPTGREAHAFESLLHTKYKRKRLPIRKMKQFHRNNGYNECYPLEMLDTLMGELDPS